MTSTRYFDGANADCRGADKSAPVQPGGSSSGGGQSCVAFFVKTEGENNSIFRAKG